ncbi:glucoside xylosyltransferase 1 [Copidosoma floridanum]|uniref:glucoside xylosyltransferase 1 n=1 Tax=Copidosoma floridanum TaxID=29053 RepID=UPI000C6F8709|nr:glucoside xylosyltransferase 1 [Copidosoma floridanum]
MKSPWRLLLLILSFGALFILFNYQTQVLNKINHEPTKKPASKSMGCEVVICVVACGINRLDESLTMLKSALVFSKRPLRFIVISDYALIPAFHEKLTEWKHIVNKTFNFVVRPVTFPDIADVTMWRKLFKPCAAQRLFLPSVLNDTDAVLYVDTDTLFLTPPEDVWDEFEKMNSSQLAALSPEHEDPNTGWYNRFARHPYYGKLGVNSGVMLMNLTRMREFKWIQYVIPIHKEYRLKITWGDQDIINIIFHYHPEKLHVYSCRYNYRPDHCMYMSVCSEAEKEGALVLHGSRGTFHSEKQPPFKAIYSAMEEYQIHMDPYEHLLLPMKNYLLQDDHANCGKVWKVFIIQPEKHLGKNELTKR